MIPQTWKLSYSLLGVTCPMGCELRAGDEVMVAYSSFTRHNVLVHVDCYPCRRHACPKTLNPSGATWADCPCYVTGVRFDPHRNLSPSPPVVQLD